MLSPEPEVVKKGVFGGLFRRISEPRMEASSFMDPDLVDAPASTEPQEETGVVMGQAPSGSIDLASGKPSSQPQALGSRLGGWLSNATIAAGSRLGVAAQKGATAIQRLSGTEKFQDYHEALQRLESSAAELRGEAREAALRRWVAVLKELGTLCGGLAVAGASARTNTDDSDWQNLHMSPFEGMTDIGNGQSAIKANEMLFVDSEHEDEVLTFREVFLGSCALELILAGYIDQPPKSDVEQHLLAELLAATLIGDLEAHQEVAELFYKVARHREAAQHPIVLGEQDLGALVASAIGALKLQAGVELLDRKMATLRANISDKAAQGAMVYKFNAGAAHPTKGSSASTVAAGLAATAEVVQLNATLTHLAAQRGALVASAPSPYFSPLIDQLQEHSAETGDGIAEVVRRLELTRAQKSEGEAYRAAKLAEMSAGLEDVVANISVMEQRKAALLQELEVLDQKLFKAKAQWADLDEGRNVFEEGNAFTMEALQQQLDQLLACHGFQEAEEKAVEAAAELLGAAVAGWVASRPSEMTSARGVEVDTGREYMHAATRHCYYQRAELQLLLRQLRFCGAELHAIHEKKAEVLDIGQQYFKSVMLDMKAGQSRLASKYVQCETSMLRRLTDLTILRCTFAPCATPGDEEEREAAWHLAQQIDMQDAAGALLGAQLQPIPMSEELEDVFQSMDVLREEFEHLPRPQGLPPLGEPLHSHPQSELSELRDATASEVAAAEAHLAELAGDADSTCGTDFGSDHSDLSDRSLPDIPAHHKLPPLTEGDSAAVADALAACEATEMARVTKLLEDVHPASAGQLDVASATVAAHGSEMTAAAKLSSSAVGILAAAVAVDTHPGAHVLSASPSLSPLLLPPPANGRRQQHLRRPLQPEPTADQQQRQQLQQKQRREEQPATADGDGVANAGSPGEVRSRQSQGSTSPTTATNSAGQPLGEPRTQEQTQPQPKARPLFEAHFDGEVSLKPRSATHDQCQSKPQLRHQTSGRDVQTALMQQQRVPFEVPSLPLPKEQQQQQHQAEVRQAGMPPDAIVPALERSPSQGQGAQRSPRTRPQWASTSSASPQSEAKEEDMPPFKAPRGRRLGGSIMDRMRNFENNQ